MKACIIGLTVCCIIYLSACSIIKPPLNINNQHDRYYWSGRDSLTNYALYILDAEGIWFNGLLLQGAHKDSINVFYLRGFEKGGGHPTFIKTNTDSTGFIFINTKGKNADTLVVQNNRDEYVKELPTEFLLFKQKKPRKKINKH